MAGQAVRGQAVHGLLETNLCKGTKLLTAAAADLKDPGLAESTLPEAESTLPESGGGISTSGAWLYLVFTVAASSVLLLLAAIGILVG